MLGLAMREAGECQRCHGDLGETTDYNWRWLPQPPIVCLRCAALQASEHNAAKHPQRGAMIHHVTKRPRPQRKKRPKLKGRG